MGLETYLFKIKFKHPIQEENLVDLFDKIGMTHLVNKSEKRTNNKYGLFYFELRTNDGLTEAECLLAPKDKSLREFSLRFSIISPKSVIEQTFALLNRLNEVTPISVYDTEVNNHIYRQLQKARKVDNFFKGIEGSTQEDTIERMCYINLDVNDFFKNEPGIRKRNIIIENDTGVIIESGSATFNYINNNGTHDKYIGWINDEI
jgi:hypothetical protein